VIDIAEAWLHNFNMQLNPIHVTVANLLEGRLFRIPGYQRAYSWGRNQRSDLFKDIDEAHRSGRDHFMATVVGLARNTVSIVADEFRIVELVDGQQRVTTLVILLKAVEKALSADDVAAAKAKIGLADLLVKGDEHSLVLLQTNHDSSNVFTDYIRKGEIGDDLVVTKADGNVVEAIHDCERFVSDWAEKGLLVDLLATIRNRMSMILHEVADESVVYRVFEVLNSRGLDVKWVDKLKSQLMASIYEHVPVGTREDGLTEMHVIWQNIYRAIGRDADNADEALQFAGTFGREKAPKRILSEEDAAREILRAGGTDIKTIIEAGRRLETVNRLVHDLHKDERRRAPAKILHARFVAIAIMLRGFKKPTTKDLLTRWERASFRLFGLARLDARSLIKEFVQLGHEIVGEELGAKAVAERLDAIGEEFDVGEVMQMKSYWDEWYWRKEDVRYVLFRYDEHLASEAGEKINASEWNKIWAHDPAKSIEHVKPQHTEAGYLHNLGNLTMLPPSVNSSLGGRPPNKKADTYVECGLKGTAAVGRAINGGLKWDKAAVTDRCAELEKFIREHWKV
jgi:hypothetical protein